jgi:hypothetical protein
MKIFCAAWLLVAAALAGCSAVPGTEGAISNPWRDPSGQSMQVAPPPSARWDHLTFPGKAASKFSYARNDGRDAVAATAASSASMLRRKVRIEHDELGSVRFSWKVPELIAEADMATRDADDSPVRIILAFEGDRSHLSARDSMLSELALTLTGEEMPYATLMYVWCNKREPGTVITSARTGRVRAIVMESGPRKLGQWLDYERNIRADYQRAFGEAPGALIGIAVMTDSDNTRTTARAWYGPVSLGPPSGPRH